MFDSIASRYDRGNAVLSFNMHKIWNRRLIKETLQFSYGHTFLDLCCGTGEIGLTHLKQEMRSCKAHLLDFSEEMLRCAQSRAQTMGLDHHKLTYHHADAQEIPLESSCVDGATVAYGIRNIAEPQKCFEEVFRVLRPGGHFGILELSRPRTVPLRWMHYAYLKTLLPVLGKLVATNKDAYEYLSNSIYQFVPPEQIASQLKDVGFDQVRTIPLMGGIATVLVANKL
jgi:demethylmenaquinone methyltransferase/2-methoxy-6-polyprenyl-1,4-benzoquinol methylase